MKITSSWGDVASWTPPECVWDADGTLLGRNTDSFGTPLGRFWDADGTP
ncbi:MAG: hypothetical protein AAFQ92_29065 [Bacteroidota bacterium]